MSDPDEYSRSQYEALEESLRSIPLELTETRELVANLSTDPNSWAGHIVIAFRNIEARIVALEHER